MNIKAAFEFLKKYIDTYPNQWNWLDYTEDTWINDILYGLGVSLGEKGPHSSGDRTYPTPTNPYQFADGFERFKLKLIERFDKEGLLKKYQESQKKS